MTRTRQHIDNNETGHFIRCLSDNYATDTSNSYIMILWEIVGYRSFIKCKLEGSRGKDRRAREGVPQINTRRTKCRDQRELARIYDRQSKRFNQSRQGESSPMPRVRASRVQRIRQWNSKAIESNSDPDGIKG